MPDGESAPCAHRRTAFGAPPPAVGRRTRPLPPRAPSPSSQLGRASVTRAEALCNGPCAVRRPHLSARGPVPSPAGGVPRLGVERACRSEEASDVLPGLDGADHRGSSRPLEMSATPTAVEGAAGRPSSQRDKRIHAIPESWPALALLICGEHLWTSCRRTGGSEPECRSPGSGGCGSPSTTPPPPRWEVAIRHAVQTGRRTPPDTEGAVPRRRFT